MLVLCIGVLCLGLLTGSRSMTPIAAVCWFAYLHRLHESGTWGFWSGMPVSAIVFTVLALGEYVGDKLPRTPNRTDIFPLGARIVFGGLVGALCATGLGSNAGAGAALGTVGAALGAFGAALGTVGAALGTFLFFHLRRHLVSERGLPDLPVALLEDLAAVGGSVLTLLLMTRTA